MEETVHVGGETESIQEGVSLVCKPTVALKEIRAYTWQH